jgi:tRNA dimethylallyltransferase
LETRAKVFSLQENLKKSFYDYVVAQDPFAARLHPHDTQRLSRALEVFLQTGRSIFVWQNNTNPPLTLPHVWCVLEPERDNLYAQINQRFHAMIQQGALEEVDRLIKHLPSTHMLSRAIGVQELGAYLNKKCSLPEAVEKAQQATRQYAKRQMTWFRNRVQKKIVLCDPNRDTLLQRLLLCGDVLC